MQALWTAIRDRFAADAALAAAGRQLYIGLDSGDRKTRPFVNVAILSGETFDTFGQDVVNFRLLFECWSKFGHDETDCQSILSAVHRVFDDWDHTDDDIVVEGFEPVSESGPSMVDALYQGTIEYDVTVRTVALVSPRPNVEV